ncbi:hypothetical protein FBZ88_102142 [Nitrospirillum bahiense]|uniref:Uncharacterized protein n=1 Tax=Nitrospirillum amazonense TaxID=28077 RepID=A0A560G9L4_9PROT|nr:hypothetical protein FBZ88_102142 [Nitrospirillum amazonense]
MVGWADAAAGNRNKATAASANILYAFTDSASRFL